MINYEEKMLVLLVENYRKSKKDNGTNKIARRTQIDPVKLYKKYRKNDGDLDQIEALNQAAEYCRDKGFLTFEVNGFSNEILKLYLVDEKVTEIEKYLSENYHYESKYEKRQYVEQMLAKYSGCSPVAEQECRKLRLILEKNQIPKDYLQTEMILKALVFVENNQKVLYLREASMLIYGSSKYFEENTLESVCRLLRAYKEHPCEEDELVDEILEEYHILKEKQKLSIKGDVTIWISGKMLELSAFTEGIEFFSDELEKIERIKVHAQKFVTVENRTAYFRSCKSDTVFFYLGGYASRFQRDFLKILYRDNPDLKFQHFGDIDAGGFYIYEHLCRFTGIPFETYRMSIEELQNQNFQMCLQPLTEQDRKRLVSLLKEEKFRDVAQYMLEHNVKLEQEIISYSEQDENDAS